MFGQGNNTYNHLVMVCSRRVSNSERGGAFFSIPGEGTTLRRAADRNGVAGCEIAIAVAVVTLTASVTTRPHIYTA